LKFWNGSMNKCGLQVRGTLASIGSGVRSLKKIVRSSGHSSEETVMNILGGIMGGISGLFGGGGGTGRLPNPVDEIRNSNNEALGIQMQMTKENNRMQILTTALRNQAEGAKAAAQGSTY
jgi:hypothetical protein